MGLAIGLVLAAPGLFAQAQQETTTTTVRNQGGTTTQIHTVTSVIGSSVQLQGGGNYGKIQDIVLNDSGCLEYVVVAYEDQYYAVPWTVATVNYQERSIVLNTTQQDLRQVGFSRNDWRGVTYDQVSQKARQVFRSSAGGRGGRINNDGGQRDGDRDRPERRGGPLGKDRATERPREKDASPDRVAPRDRPTGKESDRPRRKEGDARRKAEDRPAASPSEPPK